jgi:glycolate oxidase iron-sulfur subunit
MSAYVGEPKPELSDLDKCTRCGLCEQACPTYKLLRFEPDSPRGRVFLMKEVAQGDAPITEHLSQHLYQCLGCRACETVCPAGVPYGKLLERARFQIEQRGELVPARRGWRRFRSLAFERVLPNPWLFKTLVAPARLAQRIPGLLFALRSLPLPARFRRLVRMIPEGRSNHPITRREHATAKTGGSRSRKRVGLFLGCIMRSLFDRVH